MSVSKVSLTIDGRNVLVEQGASVLDAARSIDVPIPTMCAVDGLPHVAACMICMVEDHTGRLLPACSTRAEKDMVISTSSDNVIAARKTNLELLLSEHVGDCEGPCRVICPAEMDIPLMMKKVEFGDILDAVELVKQHIPFPAILGRICPAPCQKGCRSSQLDEALAIQGIERWIGDVDLERAEPFLPEKAAQTGKTIAIIGAGPAGLSAAYFLLIRGHACTIFDDRTHPGGGMRYGIDSDTLPTSIIDQEVKLIERLGVEFRFETSAGSDIPWPELQEQFDALILACGDQSHDDVRALGVSMCRTGVEISGGGLETSMTGVFAGGGLVRPGRIAVRSIAQGRAMAAAADQYLRGEPVTGTRRQFSSWIGRLLEIERSQLADLRDLPVAEAMTSIEDETTAQTESERCLHCECLKKTTCQLRLHCDDYDTDQKRFRSRDRWSIEKVVQHDRVTFEPGKCIRCGVCIRITESHGEDLGLTFAGRGFDIRVKVPFNRGLDEALTHTADLCVEHCPTAALAYPEGEE